MKLGVPDEGVIETDKDSGTPTAETLTVPEPSPGETSRSNHASSHHATVTAPKHEEEDG